MICRIVVDIADRIATVTLSNPDKLNAVNAAMWRELRSAMETCGTHPDVR